MSNDTTPMNTEFAVQRLNADGMAKTQQIAEIFNDALNKLTLLCPASREMSLVRTKLEEASFFAKKAMCNNASNQVTPEPIPEPSQAA